MEKFIIVISFIGVMGLSPGNVTVSGGTHTGGSSGKHFPFSIATPRAVPDPNINPLPGAQPRFLKEPR